MNLQLLIIDPQNDFCHPDGALFVPGAEEDSVRTVGLIRRLKARIDAIHVTMDCHHLLDIAHPLFWVDEAGKPPAPFTIIGVDDLASGRYRTSKPGLQERACEYVRRLAANGRYPLCIWPPHCLIGTWGNNIQNDIASAVQEWEASSLRASDVIFKGSNIATEHYSAVQADVPDPEDPATHLNTGLIRSLAAADVVGVMGQARSHCVANTVRDIADNIGQEHISKLWLIEDACSDVPGFEELGKRFVSELTGRGMRLSTSDSFLN